MRALSFGVILALVILINGRIYIGSLSEPGPAGIAAVPVAAQADAISPARSKAPPTDQLQPLRAAETTALPGRLSEPPMGPSLFDVTIADYELAEGYPNPNGGFERPVGGARVVFILARATNVTPVRGRLPHLAVVLGETVLRGCLIAPGDRLAYDLMRDVLPDETVEGWLCRVVPAAGRGDQLSVTANGRLGVRWRLDRLAWSAP